MKLLCLCVGLIGAAIIASVPPDFSPDSQMYVQSGFLWAHGDVTHAGTLVGSRILAILYYHLPLVIFGPSADALSLALGFAFLAYTVLVTAWSFKEISSPYRAAVVSLVVMVTGFIWLRWHFPLTEQLAIVLIVGVLYLLALSRRADTDRARWLLLIAAAVVCGLGTGVRSELGMLLPLIVALLLLDFSKKFRERVAIAASMGIIFMIALQVPPLAFLAYSGKPMPTQLTNYFLFFQVLQELGEADNGPASAELAELGSKARPTVTVPTQMSDVLLGVGPSYAPHGAEGSNRLTREAGIETIRARPGDFIKLSINTIRAYLGLSSGTLSRGVIVDWRSYEERWRAAVNKIKSVDDYRVASSARFGNDVTFPVATIFEHRLSSVSSVLGGFPLVDFRPPVLLVTMIGFITIMLAIRERSYSAPAPVAAAYFFSCMLLAGFTQGYVPRYFMSASLPLVIAFTVDIGRRRSGLKIDLLNARWRNSTTQPRHTDRSVPTVVTQNAARTEDHVV